MIDKVRGLVWLKAKGGMKINVIKYFSVIKDIEVE
jgi:hypothetical protein